MPGCERGGRGVCRGRLVHVLRRKVLFDGGKQEQGGHEMCSTQDTIGWYGEEPAAAGVEYPLQEWKWHVATHWADSR